MGGLDPGKILIVLLVALLVLGPERLPRAARQLGAAWRDLMRIREKLEEEVRSAMPDLDLPPIPAIPRGGLTGYLTGMMTSASSSVSAEPSAAGALTGEAGMAEAGSGFMLGRPEPAAHATPSGWSSDAGHFASATEMPEAVPAGWHSVGAPAPGYASGSLLSPVPVGTVPGPLDAETSFTFDEPSWN